MRYIESISDFFKSPKWAMNLLLGGVCMLIPVVGPLVILGWLITGFWARKDDQMETFPDFDFGQFGKYLERGLWPFLAMLVGGMVLGIALWIVVMIPLAIVGSLLGGSGGDGAGFLGIILGLFIFVFYIAALIIMLVVMKPTAIAATLSQDFGKSFNFPFIKRFISLVWKEAVISGVFLVVASMVLSAIGFLAFCVGVYAAAALIYFSMAHLDKQLYHLYLSRGGEPLVPSPKLTDTPPSMPPLGV